MRLFRRRSVVPLPGVIGTVRIDLRTKELTARLRPGDVAVIDHLDLDRVSAEALVGAGVAAVVNVSPSISGRYPNLGPEVLVGAGIPLVDGVGADAIKALREGDTVRLDAQTLYRGLDVVAQGTEQTSVTVAHQMAEARAGLSAQLEAFAANTTHYLREEHDLLLDGVGVPQIRTPIEGREVLVVVRGHRYAEDLAALRAYIRERQPVLIGVDGGADAILEAGHRPDIIVGDLDTVSEPLLLCGAELVAHAYRDGRVPGLNRAHSLGLDPVIFAATGTSEDVAMLLADGLGASLIVAVGSFATLVEFLDKGRASMASTFITRLRVGSKLADAKGVAAIYRRRRTGRKLMAAIVIAAIALAGGVALGVGPLKDQFGGRPVDQTQTLTAQNRALQSQIDTLQAQVGNGESVLSTLVGPIISGRLRAVRVVVIALPGASSALVESLTQSLGQAGATVSGQVKLNPTYVLPANADLVANLATHLGPSGVQLPSNNPYEASAFVLADALVTGESKLLGKPDAGSLALLAAYREAGLITMTGNVDHRASLALVVGGPAPGVRTRSTDTTNADLLPLLTDLKSAGKGVLLAGPTGADATGGLVKTVRDDADVRRLVSAQDGAELASGHVGMIFGLLEQSRGGVGQYGSGPGATQPLPTLPVGVLASAKPNQS